jgi:hypothetical protein
MVKVANLLEKKKGKKIVKFNFLAKVKHLLEIASQRAEASYKLHIVKKTNFICF